MRTNSYASQVPVFDSDREGNCDYIYCHAESLHQKISSHYLVTCAIAYCQTRIYRELTAIYPDKQ